MTARLAILDVFIQDSDEVIDAGAVDYHQILHKKAVGRVPPAMQHSRVGVEKIPDLLVIYFREGCLD